MFMVWGGFDWYAIRNGWMQSNLALWFTYKQVHRVRSTRSDAFIHSTVPNSSYLIRAPSKYNTPEQISKGIFRTSTIWTRIPLLPAIKCIRWPLDTPICIKIQYIVIQMLSIGKQINVIESTLRRFQKLHMCERSSNLWPASLEILVLGNDL